ncbi:hypothetical protein QO002_001203 [Pararhizobium capsulatum DSM 1112]|uniref:Uncharacterized protein n=1 Tax=Pararhizobium capsulatum DSM 1112 TaxID=1121113 RepID=A0ABU0BLE5_9HYPH|nr:hypothetical protein [Pararhizobium capsulatum]MDQ0319065.1 hypothetical protein [Pararhizobium capsulatum DSM 1112]
MNPAPMIVTSTFSEEDIGVWIDPVPSAFIQAERVSGHSGIFDL